jgi:hypothetical protein
MAGASPATTIHGQRPFQRRIIVAGLAGVMPPPLRGLNVPSGITDIYLCRSHLRRLDHLQA